MEKNKADWLVQPWILSPLGSSSSKPAYLVCFIITQLGIQLFHIFCWTASNGRRPDHFLSVTIGNSVNTKKNELNLYG